MAKVKDRKAYTRDERKAQILGALAVAKFEGTDGLSAKGVGRALGLEASTHLRNILSEMESKRDIVFWREDDPGIAGFRVIYALPDEPNAIRTYRDRLGQIAGVRETKKERDERLMLAINIRDGQKEIFS